MLFSCVCGDGAVDGYGVFVGSIIPVKPVIREPNVELVLYFSVRRVVIVFSCVAVCYSNCH